MSTNDSYIDFGPDRRRITIEELSTYGQPELRAFREQLKGLVVSLDLRITEIKEENAVDPGNREGIHKLHKARRKRNQAYFFLSEVKAREAILQASSCQHRSKGNPNTGLPKSPEKLNAHKEHQLVMGKFGYFRRTALVAMVQQLIGDDEYARLLESAKLIAIEDLTEWARLESVQPAILEHVISSR